MGNQSIAWAVLGLLAGCAINTEPIPAQDAGLGGAFGGSPEDSPGGRGGASDQGAPHIAPPADAGAPGSFDELGGFPEGPAHLTCDVDLSCTEGCAEDLDCDDRFGPRDGEASPPGGQTFDEALPDEGARLAMEAGSERWLGLSPMEGDVAFRGAVGPDDERPADLVLAVYGADGALLGRSGEVPDVMMVDMPPTEGAWLRVVWMGEAPTSLRLVRVQR